MACPLLEKLPPELRLRIYDLVFDREYREAAPVLYQATTFAIIIYGKSTADPPWADYRYLGKLEGCMFMKAIKKLRLGVNRNKSSCLEIARSIDRVNAMLSTDRDRNVDEITLALETTSNKEADPILVALTGIRMQPGAALRLGWSFKHSWHKDSASEDVFREFMEKTGISSVSPAEWQTREPGWAEQELEALGRRSMMACSFARRCR